MIPYKAFNDFLFTNSDISIYVCIYKTKKKTKTKMYFISPPHCKKNGGQTNDLSPSKYKHVLHRAIKW